MDEYCAIRMLLKRSQIFKFFEGGTGGSNYAACCQSSDTDFGAVTGDTAVSAHEQERFSHPGGDALFARR